jgi:small-conductance mechanosensitive channel
MIFEKYLGILINQNTSSEFLIALGIFVGLFIIFKIFDSFIFIKIKKSIQKRKASEAQKKNKKGYGEFFIDFLIGIKTWFYLFLAFYIAINTLEISQNLIDVLDFLMIVLSGLVAGLAINHAITEESKRYLSLRKEKNKAVSKVKVLVIIIKGIVWIIILLTVLANLGVEITALVAGIGIGGIAIALALQAILGDLFASFSIYFDKPFEEGDFIIIGSDMGTVKEIGIKTTRIQTLQGQELVISNSEMTRSRINNYKKMKKRRVVFEFGVTYNTPNSRLKKINDIVDKIIKKIKIAEIDRVNFKNFGDSSLVYEAVYYLDTSDYNEYMNVQEKINLELKKEFEKAGIEFAFPTRTVYLEK